MGTIGNKWARRAVTLRLEPLEDRRLLTAGVIEETTAPLQVLPLYDALASAIDIDRGAPTTTTALPATLTLSGTSTSTLIGPSSTLTLIGPATGTGSAYVYSGSTTYTHSGSTTSSGGTTSLVGYAGSPLTGTVSTLNLLPVANAGGAIQLLPGSIVYGSSSTTLVSSSTTLSTVNLASNGNLVINGNLVLISPGTVDPNNQTPTVAAPLNFAATEGEATFTIDLLAGASDADGDALSVAYSYLTAGSGIGIARTGNTLTVNPAAFNHLSVGEQAIATCTYAIMDGHGGFCTQTVKIVINGENDAPTVAGALSQTVSEDAAAFTVDLLTGATDPDHLDTLSVVGLVQTGGDTAGVTLNGNTLSVNPSVLNNLSVGEQAVFTYSYDIVDGLGGVCSQTAKIVITGANDAPTVAGAITRMVSEGATAFTVDLLTGATDADRLDTLSVFGFGRTSGTAAGTTIQGSTLSIDPTAYNYLAVGEQAVSTYSYYVTDGHGGYCLQTAKIVISGENDGPSVGGALSVTVSEDAAVFTGNLLAGATDPDCLDTLSVAGLLQIRGNAAGVTVQGNTLSFDPRAYNYLAAGQTEVIEYRYQVVDGHGGSVTQSATIQVTGANDGPSFTSFANSNAGLENGTLSGLVTLSGTLTDADLTDGHRVTIDWGDGRVQTFDASKVAGQSTASFQMAHQYQSVGIRRITTTVTDSNGGTIAGETTAVSAGVTLLDGTLYVIGTGGADSVSITPTTARLVPRGPMVSMLRVDAKFGVGAAGTVVQSTSYQLKSVSRLAMYLGGGDDLATVAAKVNLTALLAGGDGNDRLTAGGGLTTLCGGNGNDVLIGGAAADLLLGGAGNDSLSGGAGRDLLIGDGGADDLRGGAGDDVLIGDCVKLSVSTLEALRTTWNSSAKYDVRAAALASVLQASGTTVDDQAIDRIAGEGNQDLFAVFSSSFSDTLRDRAKKGETLLTLR